MNKADSIIHDIRRAISKVAEQFETRDEDLVKFLNVVDVRAYSSVIDALYLLEDTQMAKAEFATVDFKEESFGKLYLLFYGVLNACYMQQQAVLVIFEKLGIPTDNDDIKEAEIVSYRNDFSAHSSNRGYGNSEHSYILDRHAMREGKVKGYSSNHHDGNVYREAEVTALISNWDILMESKLQLIGKRILGEI